MINREQFERNNQTIANEDESQEQLTDALAENLAYLLLNEPLTPDQQAAIDEFMQK